MHGNDGMRQVDKALLPAAIALLLLCVVAGGNSAQTNLGLMIAQLLAIPLLIVSIALAIRGRKLWACRWGVLAAALIGVLPLLQLLPLPAALWVWPIERQSLLADLQAAGISDIDWRWTLSPAATERDFYFLLPGLALFFCMLGSGLKVWRWMLGTVVAVGVANLALAFAQVIAGQDSVLNPYPQFAPAMGGVFANRNHQADLLAIGLMVSIGLLMQRWRISGEQRLSNIGLTALVCICLLLVFALPLVGSRAGVIVAMVMLMATVLTAGLPSWKKFRHSWSLKFGALGVIALFAIGIQAALSWMQVDQALEGSRNTMLTETLRIGDNHAPLGSGVGTFVAAFQQGASDVVPLHAYINNAHNEYAQWWLEAGFSAWFVLVICVVALVNALYRLLRLPEVSNTRMVGMAAMMGVGVVLLHSTVDYPLRTQALSAVFGVLAGIAVAASTRNLQPNARSSKHE